MPVLYMFDYLMSDIKGNKRVYVINCIDFK